MTMMLVIVIMGIKEWRSIPRIGEGRVSIL